MCHKGWYSFDLEGKKILAVHGSKEDYYWKAIEPDNVKGDYQDYDLVLSGHSHYSFIFTKFYETYNLAKRNKHVVCFINPGSVGQPRNHNANAQYALLDADNMTVVLRAVEYDIEAAMNLYNNHVDEFYRKRLKEGI
jgi:predicted phosphodiesterase